MTGPVVWSVDCGATHVEVPQAAQTVQVETGHEPHGVRRAQEIAAEGARLRVAQRIGWEAAHQDAPPAPAAPQPADVDVQAEFLRRMSQHIEHGGWKCHFCGFDGQDNQQGNRFCAKCRRHR